MDLEEAKNKLMTALMEHRAGAPANRAVVAITDVATAVARGEVGKSTEETAKMIESLVADVFKAGTIAGKNAKPVTSTDFSGMYPEILAAWRKYASPSFSPSKRPDGMPTHVDVWWGKYGFSLCASDKDPAYKKEPHEFFAKEVVEEERSFWVRQVDDARAEIGWKSDRILDLQKKLEVQRGETSAQMADAVQKRDQLRTANETILRLQDDLKNARKAAENAELTTAAVREERDKDRVEWLGARLRLEGTVADLKGMLSHWTAPNVQALAADLDLLRTANERLRQDRDVLQAHNEKHGAEIGRLQKRLVENEEVRTEERNVLAGRLASEETLTTVLKNDARSMASRITILESNLERARNDVLIYGEAADKSRKALIRIRDARKLTQSPPYACPLVEYCGLWAKFLGVVDAEVTFVG